MAEQTIRPYETKGFKNEGVSNSTPVDRVVEFNGKPGITTDVMKVDKNEKNVDSSVKKVVGSPVDGEPVGQGMTDTESVMTNKWPGKKTSQSAGMVGANNANHS